MDGDITFLDRAIVFGLLVIFVCVLGPLLSVSRMKRSKSKESALKLYVMFNKIYWGVGVTIWILACTYFAIFPVRGHS